MSGGDAYHRSASAQGQKRATGPGTGVGASMGTPSGPTSSAKDLSNAKLALNQSVSQPMQNLFLR